LAGLLLLVLAPVAQAQALELVQTIVLKGKPGKLDHLALDGQRDRLFLANTVNGTLDVVDLKTGKLLRQVPGQTGVQGLAYAADLDRLFVGLGGGGLCNVFDGATYKLLKTFSSAATPTTSATTRPGTWCSWPTMRSAWASSTPSRSPSGRPQAAGHGRRVPDRGRPAAAVPEHSRAVAGGGDRPGQEGDRRDLPGEAGERRPSAGAGRGPQAALRGLPDGADARGPGQRVRPGSHQCAGPQGHRRSVFTMRNGSGSMLPAARAIWW